MLCEYSLFSFCTLFPVAGVSYVAWNYEYVAKLLAYDSDLGIVKFGKDEVQVNTSMGRLRLPHLTLPSYDWTVGLFVDDVTDVQDGFNSTQVIEENATRECMIYRNKLICEYTYPQQFNGRSRVRGYIGSIFDGECLVFTVKDGQPIDYQRYCNELMVHLEDL